MIVLDTNVVSELMKPVLDSKVFTWVERLPVETVFCTAITKAEILYGVEILPDGRRKRELRDAVAAVFERELRGRILPSDDRAADVAA